MVQNKRPEIEKCVKGRTEGSSMASGTKVKGSQESQTRPRSAWSRARPHQRTQEKGLPLPCVDKTGQGGESLGKRGSRFARRHSKDGVRLGMLPIGAQEKKEGAV